MFFLSPWICSLSCADMVFIFPLRKGPVLPQICSSSFSIWYLPVLTAGLHLSLDKDFIFTQIFSSLFQRYGHHLSFDIMFIFPQLQCLHVLRYDLLPQIWWSHFFYLISIFPGMTFTFFSYTFQLSSDVVFKFPWVLLSQSLR
jgi:hypothetical protein